MRALVIDDSKASQEILSSFLKELAFEVFTAKNGREGLELLKKLGGADVALVDWIMPEMDGLEFVRAVRSDHAHDRLRLVMVTTLTATTEIAKALEAGADEYVMKPVTKEIIREKLELLEVFQP